MSTRTDKCDERTPKTNSLAIVFIFRCETVRRPIATDYKMKTHLKILLSDDKYSRGNFRAMSANQFQSKKNWKDFFLEYECKCESYFQQRLSLWTCTYCIFHRLIVIDFLSNWICVYSSHENKTIKHQLSYRFIVSVMMSRSMAWLLSLIISVVWRIAGSDNRILILDTRIEHNRIMNSITCTTNESNILFHIQINRDCCDANDL